jgi:hypothetical protein
VITQSCDRLQSFNRFHKALCATYRLISVVKLCILFVAMAAIGVGGRRAPDKLECFPMPKKHLRGNRQCEVTIDKGGGAKLRRSSLVVYVRRSSMDGSRSPESELPRRSRKWCVDETERDDACAR